MFDINTKVQWRTGGRGVFRVLKGTVIAIVKAHTIPKTKAMQELMPHGTKPSNRSRYIVEVKDGVFCWANIKTCWKQGEKMPPAKHRFENKVKSIKTKPAKTKAKTSKAKTSKAKTKPVEAKPDILIAKRSKTAPKTTWYGLVDGKVIAARKVLCPEGFSKIKPEIKSQPETSSATVAATEATTLPTA